MLLRCAPPRASICQVVYMLLHPGSVVFELEWCYPYHMANCVAKARAPLWVAPRRLPPLPVSASAAADVEMIDCTSGGRGGCHGHGHGPETGHGPKTGHGPDDDLGDVAGLELDHDRVHGVVDHFPGGVEDRHDALAPLLDRADYGLAGGVTIVPFDTPQSVALFGHQGITRDDPDYMAAYVVNEVFGGSGFEARLMEEVREKRGLTYGIGTFLAPMEYGELVLGQVRSDNDTIAEAIEVIRAEWARLADRGLTAEELQDAKTYLTGAYALRFDGNAPIARIMVGMQMSGLPVDYLRTRNDQVNALTLDQVNRVARRLYDADALHFVVVGQPEGLAGAN